MNHGPLYTTVSEFDGHDSDPDEVFTFEPDLVHFTLVKLGRVQVPDVNVFLKSHKGISIVIFSDSKNSIDQNSNRKVTGFNLEVQLSI